MLEIKIRVKGTLTVEELKTMADIAESKPDMGWNYNSMTNTVDPIANYVSWEDDGKCYHYRVNLGHDLITFFKIER